MTPDNEVAGISIENYNTREDLANAERRAIRVERPLHNIAHMKDQQGRRRQRAHQDQGTAPPQPSLTDSKLTNLFSPATPESPFASLFGQRRRETCYGYITDEEYEQRAAIDRAKWVAIEQCPLCDDTGYRNMYVCNHIDQYSRPSAIREAKKRLLRIIEGGI